MAVSRAIRIAIAMAALAVTANVLAATPALAASTYCSPTGDLCYAAKKRNGAIRITFDTFSFDGRVNVCVTPPRGSRQCRSFRLRRGSSGLYGFDVRWSAHFSNRGRGRYSVRFRAFAGNLGPPVDFRR